MDRTCGYSILHWLASIYALKHLMAQVRRLPI